MERPKKKQKNAGANKLLPHKLAQKSFPVMPGLSARICDRPGDRYNYWNSFNKASGACFACDSIETPACTKICLLVKVAISAATSKSK